MRIKLSLAAQALSMCEGTEHAWQILARLKFASRCLVLLVATLSNMLYGFSFLLEGATQTL
jgi:hypothetical protein